jgi:hypothetical protein
VTDGDRFYLGDFGLWLDPTFELSDSERAFAGSHQHFDAAGLLCALLQMIIDWTSRWEDTTRQEVTAAFGGTDINDSLPRFDTVCAAGQLDIHPKLLAVFREHREVMIEMGRFFVGFARGDKQESRYDDAKLQRLLAVGN